MYFNIIEEEKLRQAMKCSPYLLEVYSPLSDQASDNFVHYDNLFAQNYIFGETA